MLLLNNNLVSKCKQNTEQHLHKTPFYLSLKDLFPTCFLGIYRHGLHVWAGLRSLTTAKEGTRGGS